MHLCEGLRDRNEDHKQKITNGFLFQPPKKDKLSHKLNTSKENEVKQTFKPKQTNRIKLA